MTSEIELTTWNQVKIGALFVGDVIGWSWKEYCYGNGDDDEVTEEEEAIEKQC